jgi:hypothetical protein
MVITTTIEMSFSSHTGQLIHPRLGETLVWKQHEFHTWWILFESTMNHPLSRTIVNAFVDTLEFKNLLRPKRGLFGGKKFQSELHSLSTTLGWGAVNLKSHLVINSAHPLLSVAFAQYVFETLEEKRFKVRWTEPRSQTVQLELDFSQPLPSPSPFDQFPWSNDSPIEHMDDSAITLECRDGHELLMEGERVVLIPTEAFERFFVACLPYTPIEKFDWFTHDIESFEPLETVLPTVIHSVSTMFLKGERPVYIIDESSWSAYFASYLNERGWGDVVLLGYNSETFELNATIKPCSSVPFTLGMICGMWQRAHGRAFQLHLTEKDDIFYLTIQSLLEYQNHP